jgi:hypothetical protein
MAAIAEAREPHARIFYIDEQRAQIGKPPTLLDEVIGLLGDQIPNS